MLNVPRCEDIFCRFLAHACEYLVGHLLWRGSGLAVHIFNFAVCLIEVDDYGMLGFDDPGLDAMSCVLSLPLTTAEAAFDRRNLELKVFYPCSWGADNLMFRNAQNRPALLGFTLLTARLSPPPVSVPLEVTLDGLS